MALTRLKVQLLWRHSFGSLGAKIAPANVLKTMIGLLQRGHTESIIFITFPAAWTSGDNQ
jgi:hypothetical protein